MEGFFNHLTRDGTLYRNPTTVVELFFKPDTQAIDTYGFSPADEGELIDAIEYRLKRELGIAFFDDTLPDGLVAICKGQHIGSITYNNGSWSRMDKEAA